MRASGRPAVLQHYGQAVRAGGYFDLPFKAPARIDPVRKVGI